MGKLLSSPPAARNSLQSIDPAGVSWIPSIEYTGG